MRNTCDTLQTWRIGGNSRYDPTKAGLPVREEEITQIERGQLITDSAMITTADVALFYVHVGARSTGITVADRDYATFAFPISWSGELIVNAESAGPNRVYVVSDEYYVHGGRREILGFVLRRQPFVETVAALRGTGPEEMGLAEPSFVLTPAASERLRRRSNVLLNAIPRGVTKADAEKEVFGMMVDAYLQGRPDAVAIGAARRASRIVRKAEDRFVAAQGASISLADLCAATGVGKSTLYQAFSAVCGMAPLAYFHKRKLTKARSILLEATGERGAVKRAALESGLTELGRFSVEYRRLFGESPSETLQSSPG